MCGILGYLDYENNTNIDRKIFSNALDLLAHRGPDDSGIYFDIGIALGHQRLTILDLTALGRQPMASPDKNVWVTYNGEIYNFKELKRTLEQKGHHFVSTSDTEILLHAYLEWGIDCLKYLNGIFAFGIWDSRFQRLWLVRDHIGVKPLFYTNHKGILYFASEVPPLLSFPEIPKEPDLPALDAYFTFGYVPAPMTGYKSVRQLLPGHYLLLENGQIKIESYWDLPLNHEKNKCDEQSCREQMDELFTSVVHRQMISDVPLGIFLSAGTDSFAVARAASKAGSGKIHAFSIGFKNKKYDELEKTKIAARALDVHLTSKIFDDPKDELLDKVANHSQEPFADSSSLAVYLLCQMTSENVKVALSGDGADELLGGYTTYKANDYAKIYRKIPSFIRNGLIKPLSKWVPDVGGKYTYKEKFNRFIYGAENGKWRDHASWRVIIPEYIKKEFYTPEFYNQVKDFDAIDLYKRYIIKAKEQGCSDLDACLYADLKFYLPNDMLVKVDRMSMAHGLEVRVPFLDIEMVNFCWQLPENLKIKNGVLKYILRKLIEKEYPLQLQKMPKSGFNTSYKKNLSAPLPVNNFYDIYNLSIFNSFSKYSQFLVEYAVYIFNYILKKNR